MHEPYEDIDHDIFVTEFAIKRAEEYLETLRNQLERYKEIKKNQGEKTS